MLSPYLYSYSSNLFLFFKVSGAFCERVYKNMLLAANSAWKEVAKIPAPPPPHYLIHLLLFRDKIGYKSLKIPSSNIWNLIKLQLLSKFLHHENVSNAFSYSLNGYTRK